MIYDGGLLKYYSGVDVIYLLGQYTVYYDTASVYKGMGAIHKRVKLDQDSSNVGSKQDALEAVNANKQDKLTWPKSDVNHDHHPENDAENMVNKWIFIQQNM